jgi:hypothetical protein
MPPFVRAAVAAADQFTNDNSQSTKGWDPWQRLQGWRG